MPASEGTRLITPASGGTSAYQYVPDGIKDDIEEPMEISMYDNDLASGTPPSNEGFFCSSGASKSFVFGGYDGVLASLIVLSAAVGGGMTNRAVLAVGFATVIASALSIGITEYRSSKAHQDFLQAEKRRELWEFKHCRDKEISSMVTRLERRGMSRADAQVVVSKMAQYENVFVNLMVVEDLGLQISDEDEQLFFVDAFMMFLSFGVMGLLPIVVFWLSSMLTLSRLEVFSLALVFAIVLLGVLGMIKSSFSSSSSVYSVVEAVILGTFCSAVSFAIGFIIQAL